MTDQLASWLADAAQAQFALCRPWKCLAGCRSGAEERRNRRMGALLDSMGDLEGARSYYEQALAIRKKVLGEKHPNTAVCLNNIDLLLKEMGEL